MFTVSLRSLERIDAPNFLRHLMALVIERTCTIVQLLHSRGDCNTSLPLRDYLQLRSSVCGFNIPRAVIMQYNVYRVARLLTHVNGQIAKK